MTITLVLPTGLASDIDRAAKHPLETAGVLLATAAFAPNGDLRLLARELWWVEDNAYMVREPDRLSIASHGYVPALSRAESLGAIAIWFHTHPAVGMVPRPSAADRDVDREIADLFRLRSSSPFYGTLIVSPRATGVVFTGSLQREGVAPVSIDRMWEVGNHWRLSRAEDSRLPPLSPIFDRNVRAFGGAIQAALGDLRIGIVGCGGTGSALAEQVVRLGVRHLTVIDPDQLTESNLTRVYGSTSKDIGTLKVEIMQRHLSAIAPDLACDAHAAMITNEPVARSLTSCDLVFGCTDDNAGRLVLSRLSTYMLTPVIDCGVLISSDQNGQITGIDGRVTTLSPGAACLVCRGRVDVARASAELLAPEERARRVEEGYAPALGRVEPAVVAYTTAVAAAAVGEMIERLTGYGPTPRPDETLLRCHERHISTNLASPQTGHYCDPASGKWGAGAGSPFLEQLWPGS